MIIINAVTSLAGYCVKTQRWKGMRASQGKLYLSWDLTFRPELTKPVDWDVFQAEETTTHEIICKLEIPNTGSVECRKVGMRKNKWSYKAHSNARLHASRTTQAHHPPRAPVKGRKPFATWFTGLLSLPFSDTQYFFSGSHCLDKTSFGQSSFVGPVFLWGLLCPLFKSFLWFGYNAIN